MLANGASRLGVLCGGIKRRLPGEMWTPRRLASERRMPTVGRSGRSDYRRSCGVSVGWKASRSLLIVQLRQSNNVRLPCAVALRLKLFT